ncbi:FkbM family methyltransferase [Hymenobacter sp. HD11105]
MGLKNRLKKAIIAFLPEGVKSEIRSDKPAGINPDYDSFINLSFAQEGEDLVLFRLLNGKLNGYYVDIGAHHPFRFSNTYKYYLSGWSGINIDPLPYSMDLFKKYRSRDVNLEIAILKDPLKEVTYYMFDEPALNTFNKDLALERNKDTPYKLEKEVSIKPYRLSDVLDEYLPDGQQIDFLSVDVEGMDLEVLESNNWNKYKPSYIIAESVSSTLEEDFNSNMSIYLFNLGYKLVSKTANSIIYSL